MDFIPTEPTPLKHSILDIDIGKTPIVRSATSTQVVCLSNVKSAIEWLKEQLKPKYELAQSEYIKLNWENEYKITLRIIDDAFPDLCPSGDLIADKQNPPEENRTRCPKCNKFIFTAFKSERCDCAD